MKTFKTRAGTELPMLDLKGKDYLQVAWRLVWFREEKPNWSIETEHLGDSAVNSATFKASIKDESGRVIQIGHGYEDKDGFPDFREKAETKAVGRALAMLGYGTQFAPELEEGERLADSPLARPKPFQGSPIAPKITAKEMVPGPNDGVPAHIKDVPPAEDFPPSMQEGAFDFEGGVTKAVAKAMAPVMATGPNCKCGSGMVLSHNKQTYFCAASKKEGFKKPENHSKNFPA